MMRKLVSATIVCAIMLTLFLGLFGGVVEEVEASATYDSMTNTIYINGFDFLSNISSQIGNNSIFEYYPSNDTAITHYHLHINGSGILKIYQGQTLKFDIGRNLIVDGILNATGSMGGEITFTSIKDSPQSGDWGQIKFNGAAASYSTLIHSYVRYGTVGIFCNSSSPSIINTEISYNSQNGIFIDASSPIFKRNLVMSNGGGGIGEGGIYIDDSQFEIENCTLIDTPYNDLILVGTANVTSLNTTFDNENLNPPTSQLYVKWYGNVRILDEDSGNPIQGTNIQIKDSTGSPIEGSPFTSNSNGYARWVKFTEYIDYASSPTQFFTPHNFNVSHDEYYTNETDIYIGSFSQLVINLTMIQRDLTTTPSDITFSPPGVPAAGEELIVRAKIYNVEVDDAQNVRVLIIDGAPEGNQEIHNSIIGEIKGLTYKNAIDVWNPTPGVHTIEVYIDPYNEISEINSTTGSEGAEGNNNVTTEISVNARPVVNISSPGNYYEVKETVTIEGSSWDTFADNVPDLPGNEIAQIDVRLLDHDWVEADTPYIFNFTSGGWDWTYEWDTNYWNNTALPDGNYTLQARAWDNYHYSYIYEIPITVNNTGANMPPNPVIDEPLNNSVFNVYDVITFNCTSSYDDQTAPGNLIYSWDFNDQVDGNGDGDYTNDQDASGNITTHAYDAKGIFTVTLNVTDEGDLYNTTSVTVIINNYRPVVILTVDDTTPYVNDTVTFNGSDTYDPDGIYEDLIYEWDFGDGIIIITYWPVVVMNHTYTETGLFTAYLNVTDINASSNSTSLDIDVQPNEAPNAFINEPFEGQRFDVNETIIFNASGSSDPNDADLKHLWDFGDGTDSGELSQPVTTHSYSEYGPNILPFPFSYTVTLTVMDDEGLTDTAIVNIQVNNYPPVAIAVSDVTSADTYQDITFDGTGSYDPNDAIVTYLWDFDDGTIAITPTATHQFEQNGDYNVTLTVTDGFNANDTDWIIISIANREPVIVDVTVDPESPIVDEEVTITINATDEDGMIVRYFWNFGDGYTYFENTTYFEDGAFDGITTHTYMNRGDYNIIIEVEDDDDLKNSTAKLVSLLNAVPEVTIDDPNEGQTVSEITTISGTSNDRDGLVTSVEVKIDDGDWVEAQDTSSDDSWSAWSYDWDTEDGYVNGDHMIYARAYDGENYTEPPENISVTVDNLPSSITATINLDPETVEAKGTVNVYGTVVYNTGDPVEDALINVTILNEVGSWETTTSIDGSYSIDITAPDTAKNHRINVNAKKDSFADTKYQILTVTPLPEKPDLTLTNNDIDFNPSAPFSGETVQITITVYNNGDSNANSVLINVYDGNPQAGGTSIGSKTTSVSANGNTDVNVDWVTTGITGLYNVYVILDPNNDIEEEDEDNNQAQRPITITGRPDFTLEATDISFSNENPSVGDTISILIKIYNDGTESGSVYYEVFEGDPDMGGSLIASNEETISKNDDKTVIVQWTPEKSGEFDIYVVLDRDEDVTEMDEDNNEAYATITVEEEPKDGGIPSWMVPAMLVIVVIVVIIILFMYMQGRGPRQPRPRRQELPLAQVVEGQPKQQAKKTASPKEEEKEVEGLMGGPGGIRIG